MNRAAILSSLLSLSLAAFAGQSPNPGPGTQDSFKIVDVVAKNYEFTPNEIHVAKGTRVQLKLRTADRAHGLTIDIYPEGARKDGHPGLIFPHAQDNAKVEHDQERIIEFVAERVGTYDFKCSVQCGLFGHGRMTGKLVVDE
jgi:cytochrome c oxidase subunit 2